MINNSSIDCPIALAVVSTPGFQSLISLEIAISTAAICSNSLFLAVIGRVGVFHVNLKLLLGNFNLVLYAYSIGFLYKSLLTLTTLWNGNICTFEMKAYDCKVSELVVAIPNSCVNYASLAVCLERVYCTIRYKRYDQSDHIKHWVSIVLLLICYGATFGHQLGFLVNIQRDRMTPFCENMLSMTPETATTGGCLSLITETMIVLLSLATYLFNKRQLKNSSVHRNQENLSSRYQLDQNVKINRLLTPAMILEAVLYLPTLTFLIILARGIDMSIETKIFWIHITYNFKLLFAFVQPILGFILNPQLKRSLRELFPRITYCFLSSTPTVAPIVGLERLNPAEAACTHFDQAAKLWSLGPSGKNV